MIMMRNKGSCCGAFGESNATLCHCHENCAKLPQTFLEWISREDSSRIRPKYEVTIQSVILAEQHL